MSHTALLLTGNIRTFEECIDSFNNICIQFNPDIFICISQKEFELHPYIQQEYNFYNDTVLSLELLNHKFSISPLFASKIKKIIIIDNEHDNHYTNYIQLLDTKKTWQGADIYEQVYKIKRGIEEIEIYQEQNKVKYDLIMKMRFDLTIDVTYIPLLSSIKQNELLVSHSPISEPSDTILICNSIQLIKLLYQELQSLFLYNNSHCKNIHTMIRHICDNNNININPCIASTINRGFNMIFDTKITLITCFYDIGRTNWKSYSRDTSIYFKNCEKILKQRYPIYIFTTEDHRQKILDIRKKTDKYLLYTVIIIIPFEKLKYYNKIELIQNIQKETNIGIEPEFTEPAYIILIFNKVQFMTIVSSENKYNSTIFQWIDFGIHDNIIKKDVNDHIFKHIIFKPGKIRITGFISESTNLSRKSYYNTHNSTIAAGLFGGDSNSIKILSKLVEEEINTILDERYINQEQYVLYWVLCHNKELFDYYIIDSWDSMHEYFTRSNIKIALLFSGHYRSYDSCKQNISDNIITPLKTVAHVDSFISTWSDQQYSHPTLAGNFTEYEIEDTKYDLFKNKYSKDKWNTQFSGPDTCYNAISMHYKTLRVFNMANNYSARNNFKYDIIFRIRPDIIYNNKISTHLVKECLTQDMVFMPNHHGKYPEVTKYISDWFFLEIIKQCRKL